MTALSGDVEEDMIPTDGQFSQGPQTGFMQNFHAAMSEQANVRSAFGADEAMSNLEQQQLDKLYSLTGERMAPLFPGIWSNSAPTEAKPMAVLHSLNGDNLDPGQQTYMQQAQKQIDKYNMLATAHGLPTYDDMFKQVQQNAAQDVANASSTSSRATMMGTLGGIVGGIAGSFSGNDPANIASLALGGVGKTMLARVLSEVGAGSLAQAGELLTGGYENQKLLGQAPTIGQAVGQVAEAGAGAGALRGAGELAAKGFGAIVRRFGAKAPDVAAGAIAKEAEDAIGPSPYGDSRAAQGMHTADVLDQIARDVPMNREPIARPAPFAASNFATSATDDLFAGTSQPLKKILGDVPRNAMLARADNQLTAITKQLADNKAAIEQIGATISDRRGDIVPPRQLADKKAQLAALNNQIATEANLRKLGQLNKDKAALQDDISRADAVNTDLQALVAKRQQITSQGDDLRIARGNLVEDVAKRTPGLKQSAVANRLLNGNADAYRFVDRPAANTMPQSEAMLKQVEAPAPTEAPKPKIIPAATPDETTGKIPEGMSDKEQVEVGQSTGPIDLDHMIALGIDEDGKPIFTSIRDMLQSHADDDALIANMKACLI